MATRKDLTQEKSISFKSVGEKIEAYQQRQRINPKSPPKPIGIKTPLALGGDKLFEMHSNLRTQITDNLRNLILTQKGERIGNPNFGTELRKIQYQGSSEEEIEIAMMASIQQATQKYLPYIELEDFSVDRQEDPTGASTGVLLLRITYTVPQIGPGTTGIRLSLPKGV